MTTIDALNFEKKTWNVEEKFEKFKKNLNLLRTRQHLVLTAAGFAPRLELEIDLIREID